MALLDELKTIQQAGFDATVANAQRGAVPPSSPYPEYDKSDAWRTGCEKAVRYLENRQQALDERKRREARQATVTEKLEELFGGYEEREAFEEWLAAFIDARTR